MIKRILIVGGASGIGLAIAEEMSKMYAVERVYVVDKAPYPHGNREKIMSFCFDLEADDFSFFDRFDDIDALMVTAGFGRLELFRDINEQYIVDSFRVNTVAVIRLVKRFYNRLESQKDFYCGIMVSIAGFMSSPFFSVYGATKAALKVFIESVNVELQKAGSPNCILNVSPGSIKGTSFTGGGTNLNLVSPLALQIIDHLERKDDLFIPQYDEVFHNVLERYHADFRQEGLHSYDYKLARLKSDSTK